MYSLNKREPQWRVEEPCTAAAAVASPPHGGLTLLWEWHPILQAALVASRNVVVLVAQVFNGFEVRAAGRPFHPLDLFAPKF